MNNFFKKFINLTESHTGSLPYIEYHSQWHSLCLQGESFKNASSNKNMKHWLPVQRELNKISLENDLAGIEKALGIKLHSDIKTFFTCFWSDHIDAIYQHGNLTLLFVWNDEDMQNLIKNQLGHAMDKIRNRQELSFFIACTESDFIISIENSTGHIVLERPGSKAEKILALSVGDFFDQLEPGKLS
jgi:SecY interacting protein Syd